MAVQDILCHRSRVKLENEQKVGCIYFTFFSLAVVRNINPKLNVFTARHLYGISDR